VKVKFVLLRVAIISFERRPYMELEKIKEDKKYKDIFHVNEMELEAIEQLAQQDGEIYTSLVVWKGENILIYGYQYLPVIKAHPEIKYTIRQMDFADWQEAQVWAIEHYIAQPVVLLWNKLETATTCGEYWLLKEKAKIAHGHRSESPSGSEDNSDKSNEVNAIIAQKCGCSPTIVYNFKRILASGMADIIKQCRCGMLTISGAYAKLFTPKKPRTTKPATTAPIELEITDSEIFADCECHADDGKRVRGIYPTPVDPSPIVQKIAVADVPESSIWVVLYKKQGQMQVVQRYDDKDKGNIRATINAYSCKVVENTEDRIIFEAGHIPASTTETIRKDDLDFNQTPSLAS
jgi:hypothetical protein